jgi:hypothetical protein
MAGLMASPEEDGEGERGNPAALGDGAAISARGIAPGPGLFPSTRPGRFRGIPLQIRDCGSHSLRYW